MSWEIGIATGIAYRKPILEVLEPIARSGLRAIEICTAPGHLSINDAAAVRAARDRIAALQLRVHSLHAPFGHELNISSPDAGQRRHTLDRLERAADALAAFGGGLYVIHPGGEDQRWAWEREQRLALSVEGLNQVWQACHSRGLTLVIETPLPHLLGGQPDDFAWILDRLPTEGTGICIDTSHCALGGFLLDTVHRFGSRLVTLQVSDNHGTSDDHLPPGTGRIDWARFRSALEQVGYHGVFMLEVAGGGDTAAETADAAAHARHILATGSMQELRVAAPAGA